MYWLYLLLVQMIVLSQGTQFGGLQNVCQHLSRDAEGRQQAPQPPETSHFSLSTNQTRYLPGQAMTVTIQSTSSKLIRGVILQVRRTKNSDVVGRFSASQNSDLQTCDAKAGDTITQWLDEPVSKLSFVWRAPDKDVGQLKLVATVYESSSVYWINLTGSRPLQKGFAPIDLSTCGKSKGCFRYGAKNCDVQECMYVMTHRRIGDVGHFELSAAAGWAAVGFSSDNKMGGDDVLVCMTTPDGVDIRHMWTDYQYNPPTEQDINPTYNHQHDVSDDGRIISCRFSRPLKVMNDQHSLDLNNDWFHLYTWGKVSQSFTMMRHNLDRPPTSSGKKMFSSKTDIQVNSSSRMSRSPLLVILASLVFIVHHKPHCLLSAML